MAEYLIAVVLVVNLVTFLAFGLDKRKARLEKPRIAEKTLLTFMFATGFVGGWWGMSVFRHKTVKRSFRMRAATVTVLNPAWVLLWLWTRTW